jgi:hypothetical protein
MSFSTAFPTYSPNLPQSVIITLGTVDGAILIRLHTTKNNLHLLATFIDRENPNTQFLWTNVRPNATGFDIDHQTVTIPNDSTEAFTNIQQATNHFQRHLTDDTQETDSDTERETEDPLAPPYKPSPAHSSEYSPPIIQSATEPVIPARDSSCEDTHGTEEGETPEVTEDDNSERYWCTVNILD